MAKKSISQIMAEQAYYAKHNINTEIKKQEFIPDYGPTKPWMNSLEPDQGKSGYLEMMREKVLLGQSDMSDKKIVQLLINRYQSCYDTIIGFGNSEQRILNYLRSVDCDRGVCNCAMRVFGVSVGYRQWVADNMTGASTVWWEFPCYCKTSKGMVDAIAFRLDRLKDVLKSLK